MSTLPRLLPTACLLAVLLPVSPAQAQSESDTTAHDQPPAFQKGGWGLQYEATSLNGALSGFQGGLFSGRYHLSARQALRVGVSVNATIEDGDRTRSTFEDADSTGVFERRYERDSQRYALSGEYVRYFKPADWLFVFAGVGPRVSYYKFTEEESERLGDESGVEEISRDITEYGIGVGGAVGVEWFVHPHISLSVEYPLLVEYVRERVERTRSVQDPIGVEETKRTTKVNRYEAGGESVRIGVTFSFGP